MLPLNITQNLAMLYLIYRTCSVVSDPRLTQKLPQIQWIKFELASRTSYKVIILGTCFFLLMFEMGRILILSMLIFGISIIASSIEEKNEEKSGNIDRFHFNTTRTEKSKSKEEEERLLEVMEQGYFLIKKCPILESDNYSAISMNRKGKEILQDLDLSFDSMCAQLSEIDSPHQSVHSAIRETLGSDVPKRFTRKMLVVLTRNTNNTFKGLHISSRNNSSTHKVPFHYFKVEIFKVEREEIILLLSDKKADSSSLLGDGKKSIILCTLSHELRTLLNGIIGNLELLEAHLEPKSNSKVYHEFAKCSSGLLTSKINDFIDYIQLYHKKFKLHYQEFRLSQLIDEIVSICKGLAQQKQIKFDVDTRSLRLQTMIGDHTRIMQIALNLASKAIEFSDCGSHVCLYLRRNKEGKIIFKVRSYGTGLSSKIDHQAIASSPSHRRNRSNEIDNAMEATKNLEFFSLQIGQLICQQMDSNIKTKTVSGQYSEIKFSVRDGFASKNIQVINSELTKNRRNSSPAEKEEIGEYKGGG